MQPAFRARLRVARPVPPVAPKMATVFDEGDVDIFVFDFETREKFEDFMRDVDRVWSLNYDTDIDFYFPWSLLTLI